MGFQVGGAQQGQEPWGRTELASSRSGEGLARRERGSRWAGLVTTVRSVDFILSVTGSRGEGMALRRDGDPMAHSRCAINSVCIGAQSP